MSMTLTTRCFLAVLATLAAMPLQAQDWSFEVFLDQQKIGTHTFSLEQNQLQSRANFKVKILFINAYRYQHQASEHWQGNCLTQLTAHTEENKEMTDVKAALENNQFIIEKNGSTQTLPGCIMTFAYWNPEILKQIRLLNPQNAEYLDVTVTDDGLKTIDVKGQSTLTHQYRLNGRYKGKEKLKITLWYDQQQQWVALESITPEGYKIKYKLI